ncbi:DUF368 domain-containing protein [Zhihengliuella salsuginis]|uniref:DUF368 domain-containing protein n=1 Tax=Zhihengliuella salsuginis TaxID=578222 RepID=A0ABQ3GL18_9MICC|nr:DUF368 domain-containing protein [Zhihengliuella salsuginis]GHD10154.1 hypothetical protein GCM10008096_23420 [Zhihengliuella salsuginis]
MNTTQQAPPVKRRAVPEVAANVLRGGLIGAVEVMPGVSGGTVALVVMIYERLIASASAAIAGLFLLVSGLFRGAAVRRRGLERLREVDWLLVLPLVIGMGAAILTMSRVMESLVEDHPVLMRAAFFGMVLVSLLIPIRMAGDWRMRDWLYLAVAALVTAFAVSLPTAPLEITPLTIMGCAAIAVCALALPGLSGSFLLLALGLYEPTLEAVNNRDLGYLGLFLVGAATGGVLIILGLRRLLRTRHHVTMVVITGLMAGGLRALWPWQDEARNVVPIEPGTLGPVIGLAIAGAVVVGIGVWAESRLNRK